jgi:hypothetical protein
MTSLHSDEKNISSSKEIPHPVEGSPPPEELTTVDGRWNGRLTYLKWYFTSKAGWLGDYVSHTLQHSREETLTNTGLPVPHHA